MNFKELREASGMTNSQLAEYFGIPLRTLQSWAKPEGENGRTCPAYVLGMMERILRTEGAIK